MNEVKEYINVLSDDNKKIIKRIYDIAKKLVPDAEEGLSYGMAALKYKGKGLVSAVVFKNHMSYFPYSGSIPEKLKKELGGFEYSKGTIYFSEEKQLPDETIKALVLARRDAIDEAV